MATDRECNFRTGRILGKHFPEALVHTVHRTSAVGTSQTFPPPLRSAACRRCAALPARGRFTEKTSSFTLHSFLGWLSIIGPSNHHDSAERYLVLCIYYYLVCNKKQQKYIRNQHIVRKKQLRGKNMWHSKFLPWEAVYHWAKQVS